MAAIIPPVTRLSARIIRILGCNPSHMTLQGTNTYIIGTGQKRILLDTGEPGIPNYIAHLKEVLAKEKITLSDIIVTHWHHDHIGGVEDVLGINFDTECKVWKYRRTDDTDNGLPSHIPLNWLSNNQEIGVEGAQLKIVHTPGHTTDHVVVTLLEEDALFSGDCILGEGTAVFEDLYDYMRSLDVILGLAPKVIYPGHGNVIQDPLPKIKYYIDHRNQREQQIYEALKRTPSKQFTELCIVKEVYTDTPEVLWPAAAYNVNHHLQKLTKEQKIVETKNDEGNLVWQYKGVSQL